MAARDPVTGQFISAALANRIKAFESKFATGAIVDTTTIARSVAAQVDKQTAAIFKRYTKRLKYEAAKTGPTAEVNRNVGEGARRAVIEAYASSGLGVKRSYRWQDRGSLRRYSNGAMERAFNDKEFVTYDSKSIFFADRFTLDKHAKQWYRLNFGARPRSSKQPRTPPMKFPSSMGGAVIHPGAELVGFQPSKSFELHQAITSSTFAAKTPGTKIMPHSRPSSSGALYVGTSMVLRHRKGGATNPFFVREPTRGIEGKRFLDAGSAYINRVWPKELTKLMQSWERNARDSM